jgi:hypothetical protein
MRLKVKDFFSPDLGPDPENPGVIFDLSKWKPQDESDFGIFVEAFVGPEDKQGHDMFCFIVCTPRWLERELQEKKHKGSGEFILGHHHVIVSKWDYETIYQWFVDLCKRSEADDWPGRLSRDTDWEDDPFRVDR